MTKICCECHRVMELDPRDPRVSHGLCWRCGRRAMANLHAIDPAGKLAILRRTQ